VVSAAPEQALIEFLGPVVGPTLLRWADLEGRTLWLPAEPWRAAGFTGAFTASVIVGASEPHEHDRYLVAKIVPRHDGRERGAHLDALRSGKFAERRLIGLFGPPIFCPDGQVVFFQELAGHDRRFRPAATFADADAPAVVDLCERVMAGVATQWNPVTRHERTGLATFVLDELRHPVSGTASVERWANDLGLSHPDTAWLSTPEDPGPLPNPVLFGIGHPALAGREIDLLAGHGHGDLHLGNIMVPHPPRCDLRRGPPIGRRA
jgi:hypothetical protein